MRSLLFLGGGLLIGAGLSWGEATRVAERRANQRVLDEVASHKRVLEKAAEKYLADTVPEGPALTEEELYTHQDPAWGGAVDPDEADTSEDAIKVGGEAILTTSITEVGPTTDYLAAAHDYHTSEMSAPERELEYIEAEEYDEDDGRLKEEILIHMGETEPLFISEGLVVMDWSEKISPNVLVDMYQMCPPGEDKVLYVRNHVNGTDYRVVQEIP